MISSSAFQPTTLMLPSNEARKVPCTILSSSISQQDENIGMSEMTMIDNNKWGSRTVFNSISDICLKQVYRNDKINLNTTDYQAPAVGDSRQVEGRIRKG